MKTYEVSEETMTKLKKAYIATKHHPYRVYKIGGSGSYETVMQTLGDAFANALREYFTGTMKSYSKDVKKRIVEYEKREEESPFTEWGRWFFHQWFTCAYYFWEKYDPEVHSKALIMAEIYLGQAHRFIDENRFERFSVHVNYAKEDLTIMKYNYDDKTNSFILADECVEKKIELLEKTGKKWKDLIDQERLGKEITGLRERLRRIKQ